MSADRHQPTEDRMRELMADYHDPDRPLGEREREEMWVAIQSRRAERAAPPSRRRLRPPRAVFWPVAAAAVLLVGIGIGRQLDRSAETGGELATTEQESPRWRQETAEALYRMAARGYLRRTETELVRYRLAGGVADPGEERPVTDWAAGLLVQTRLLLDSPAGEDPGFRSLLEDLEVVLARLVQATYEGPGEHEWILEGLERQDILRRLRRELPPTHETPEPAVQT